MRDVRIAKDKNELIKLAEEFIIDKIKTITSARHRCTIALAGGSTPKPIYEAIAQTDLPWHKIHVFWGDERYVPPTHPESNEKMAREAWLNHVPIPPENIHPMPTMGNNPALDAQLHEGEIRAFFEQEEGFPTFDLILLGMGDDGHTASLFPHTDALNGGRALVTVGNKGDSLRLTFTASLINQADCVVFLVSGENKIDALTQVFSDDADSNQYPSKLIQPQGELIWFIDQVINQQ